MPAKSKSQQRLFGMVHAYQKGEFHGSKELRARIRAMAQHISKTDAKHFAQTPHKDLPEVKTSNALGSLDTWWKKLAAEKKSMIKSVSVGDHIRVRTGIRCSETGKTGRVIGVKDGRSGQLAVIKMDSDGHVFQGYTASYVGEILGSTKTAQVMLKPDEVTTLYSQLSAYAPAPDAALRSAKRRSFLSRIVPGAAIGAAVGGVGMGLLGAHLGHKALANGSKLSPEDARALVRTIGLRSGLWGASRGAVAGAGIGLGLGVLDKVMGR